VVVVCVVVVHCGHIVGGVVAAVMVMVAARWAAWVAVIGMARWHVQ